MATKAHNRSRRPRRHRVRRIAKAVSGQWLLVLLSHTIATFVAIVVGQYVHFPQCGK